VINFDVPADPASYLHRVGRTARAELTGDAFTLVAPDEESDLRAIEKVLGQPLPRVTLTGFDYAARPEVMPHNPQHGHRGQTRGRSQHAPAPHRGGGGGHHGGGRPAGGGGQSHGQRRGNGGGPGRGRGQHDARMQAILDKHAPASTGDTGRSDRSGQRRRFR
jgi:ATP-dependent RNA helicase RhlE